MTCKRFEELKENDVFYWEEEKYKKIKTTKGFGGDFNVIDSRNKLNYFGEKVSVLVEDLSFQMLNIDDFFYVIDSKGKIRSDSYRKIENTKNYCGTDEFNAISEKNELFWIFSKQEVERINRVIPKT